MNAFWAPFCWLPAKLPLTLPGLCRQVSRREQTVSRMLIWHETLEPHFAATPDRMLEPAVEDCANGKNSLLWLKDSRTDSENHKLLRNRFLKHRICWLYGELRFVVRCYRFVQPPLEAGKSHPAIHPFRFLQTFTWFLSGWIWMVLLRYLSSGSRILQTLRCCGSRSG